jgi:acyl-coenzyme A thioesterase PaaI-like protein
MRSPSLWRFVGKQVAKQFTDDNRCFACGKENPIGLKMEFAPDGSGYRAAFMPSPDHQGWKGVCHGGIVATVLDEVMAQCVHRAGITAVTARMCVDFKAPVTTDRGYEVSGRIVERKGKIVRAQAELTGEDGAVAARAIATFFVVEED